MIGRLHGQLIAKHPPQLLLDVSGVGYELEAPMSTFYHLPNLGESVTLLTHLAIRDDAHILYGFSKESERTLFRRLLKISGVGARMALAILSGMTTEEFTQCVQQQNTIALTRLPGIGKKTAERLLVELRDSFEQVSSTQQDHAEIATSAMPIALSPVAEAVEALISLGYKPAEASRKVKAVATNPQLSSEDLIRAALKAAAGGQ